MKIDPFSAVAAILALIGSLLGILAKVSAQRKAKGPALYGFSPNLPVPKSSGATVLAGFAIIALIFGGFVLFWYRKTLFANADTVFFAAGLFLTMVGGMFVQVISANYRGGRPLFDVTASQLIFPLLFA